MNNNFNLAETQGVIRKFLIENGGGTVRDVYNAVSDYIPLEVGTKPIDKVAGILSGMTDLVKSADPFGADFFKVAAPATPAPEIVICSIPEPEVPCIKSLKSVHSLAVWTEKLIREHGPMKLADLETIIAGKDEFHATSGGSLYHKINASLRNNHKKFVKVGRGIFDLIENQNAARPQKKGAATKACNEVPVWKLAEEIFKSNGNQPLHVSKIVEIILEKGWKSESADVNATVAKSLCMKDIFRKEGRNTFQLAKPAGTKKSSGTLKNNITDILNACGNRPLHVNVIVRKLNESGYEHASKNLKGTVECIMIKGVASGTFKKTAPNTFRVVETDEVKPDTQISKNVKSLDQLLAEGDYDAIHKIVDEKEKAAKMKAKEAEIDAQIAALQAEKDGLRGEA